MRATALINGLEIIDIIHKANRSLRFSELLEMVNVSRPTLSAILNILKSHGYVNKSSGRYELGARFKLIAADLMDNVDIESLASEELYQLRDRTGGTVELYVPGESSVLIVAKCNGTQDLGITTRVGLDLKNLSGLAAGKIALSFMPIDLRVEYYNSKFFKHHTTESTFTDPEAVESMLATIRRMRTAIEVEEARSGVFRAAAAVLDINGDLQGIIAVADSAAKLNEEEQDRYLNLVKDCGKRLSFKLGCNFY
ncbi:MAG: IclR family transcriptional regulator [Planctomycetota bacterium]|jgi:DNA-binding IclR family transcriptional regulator